MRWLAALAIAACGSGKPGDSTHPRGGSARPDAGAPQGTADGPSERECDELVDHAIEIELAARRAQQHAKPMPTADELARLRAELRGDPGCRALSREAYRCAMAAATLAELEACYTTRSSSTSNSKVAPGGMIPAAPRSP